LTYFPFTGILDRMPSPKRDISRRDFLKLAGYSLGAITLNPLASGLDRLICLGGIVLLTQILAEERLN
jgi:hypothetical protein